MKILLLSLLLVLCSSPVLAQGISFPNEVVGYRFFQDGKLKGLMLLDSSIDEFKAALKDCSIESRNYVRCEYDSDWYVLITFLDPTYSYIASGGQTIPVRDEFARKVERVNFVPKHRVKVNLKDFGSSFKLSRREEESGDISYSIYDRDAGLSYTVFNGRPEKDHVTEVPTFMGSVIYEIPFSRRKLLFFP
jgi:hypothetical protein